MDTPFRRDEDAVRQSAELENAIEEVDHGKRLLVDLDRRLHQTREGYRAVQKDAQQGQATTTASCSSSLTGSLRPFPAPAAPSASSVWLLSSGGVFIETPKDIAMVKLQKDMRGLEEDLDEARDELKQAVVVLAHLEGPDSALRRINTGFELKAFNKR